MQAVMQILTSIVFDVTANYEQQRKCYAGKYLNNDKIHPASKKRSEKL